MSKYKPQCGLILEDKEGKILLQLRDNKAEIPYPNMWGTFGGQIEDGETPIESIKREIKEELYYDLIKPEYFGNFPFENYNIHMFRKIDLKININDLVVEEGQKGEFLSLGEIRKIKCAFNCREIVESYFKQFH